jgi:thiol-disulfide isomerase/thioredoxin
MKKNIILVVVVALIIGGIAYLESGKVTRTSTNVGTTIPLPNIGPDASSTALATATTTSESSSSAVAIVSSGAPDTTANTSTPATTNAPSRAGFLTVAQKTAQYSRAKELVSPDGYINTDSSFNLAGLVGKKVILIDFWTYSCINCQRTIPYLNAWYQKYQNAGLVIVGVHTPEFDFEKSLPNVQAAVAKFGIKYPVVLDNEGQTASAYGMQYWPEEYLIDIDGFVVDHHIGEGGYADTEAAIQNALKEKVSVLGQNIVVPTGTVTPAAAVAGADISPETYFGSNRNEYLGNGTKSISGVQNFTAPDSTVASSLKEDTLYLGGSWNVMPEYAESNGVTKIFYHYHGSNVYFVASSAQAMTLTLKRDGQPLGAEAGADVTSASTVTVGQSRLYSLVQESSPGDHVLEIDVPSAGLDAYTFTFG